MPRFQPYKLCLTLTSPAMRHWGTCPRLPTLFIFSSLQSYTKSTTASSICFPILYHFENSVKSAKGDVLPRLESTKIVFVLGANLSWTIQRKLTTLPLTPLLVSHPLLSQGGILSTILHPIDVFGISVSVSRIVLLILSTPLVSYQRPVVDALRTSVCLSRRYTS